MYICNLVHIESSFEVKVEADVAEHIDKGSFYCTVCDKWFTKKWNWKVHRKLHTGEDLFACTQCERRFPNQRYLRKHMNDHCSEFRSVMGNCKFEK